MIIKKYLGQTLQAIQEQIRRELGPEAIILTTRSIKSQGIKGIFAPSKIEATVAIDPLDLEHFTKERDSSPKVISAESFSPSLQKPAPSSSHWREQVDSLSSRLVDQFKEELPSPSASASLPSNLEELFSPSFQEKKYSSSLAHLLLSKGVMRPLALHLEGIVERRFPIKKTRAPHYRQERLSFLKKQIAALFSPFHSPSFHGPTLLCCVGTSGVGKTTALIKWALEIKEKEMGEPHFLSLHKEKGVKNHIPSSLRSTFCPSTNEVKEILSSLDGREILLLDTPGINPYHQGEIKQLCQRLALFPSLHTFLVLNAEMREIDMRALTHHFAPLSYEALIMTKMDETIAWGSVINAAQLAGKPIASLSFTGEYAEPLQPLVPTDFAHLFLTENNARELREFRLLAAQAT